MEHLTPAFLASFIEKPTSHRVERIDRDRSRWREIAGPFFDAGGVALIRSEMDAGGPHTHSQRRDNYFCIVLQGELEFRLGGKIINVHSGDLLFLPSGQASTMCRKTHASWLTLELVNNDLWKPLKQHGHYVRKYESTTLVYILISSIVKALRTQNLYSIRCAYENAEVLITILKRELDRSVRASTALGANRIADLLAQIQEHPDYQWDLPNMCRRVAMSKRSLCRAFKTEFGLPPVEMLRRIRMTLAASLLTATDRTVIDISNAVGYISPYSFSRLFKNCFGTSPKAFRHLPREKRQALLAKATTSRTIKMAD